MNTKTKGVIVNVRPDDKMPVDSEGKRADILVDPTSIPGRMNPSNLYEQYFNGISRRIKSLVVNAINNSGKLESLSNSTVDDIFDIVLNGIKLFGTEQYTTYLNADTSSKREILEEIYNRECYVYYKVSSERKPYEVVTAARGTVYEPVKLPFSMPDPDTGEYKVSPNEVIISPQYMILLANTPETYLATSSSRTNHYDLPVSMSAKTRQNVPYRNSPTKILSETETRLYLAYVGRKGLAEMKDRANSIDTHKLIYRNISSAKKPTDIAALVDRNVHPFGTDKAIEIANAILNSSGIELEYVKEDKYK